MVSFVLTLALLITLLSPFGSSQVATAATGSFSFPTEQDLATKARVTTDPRLTLTGSITGVDPASVSYSVVQVINHKGTDDPSDDQLGSKRENITSNIFINGFNMQVFNVELFPGLNRITFRGIQGGGEVTNSIYIEYHNGPVFYDLVAQLDGNTFAIEEAGTTVVYSNATAGRQSADISITGFAPNAQQVTIDVNGSSRTYSVNSSNNYQFAAAPITLNKGKNLVTIKVKNANQTVETTREVAFYNGEVTFYDVNLNGTAGAAPTSEALEYNPNLLVSNPNSTTVTGKIIVPNFLKDDSNPLDGILEPHPDPTRSIPIKYKITGSGVNLEQPAGAGASVAAPVGTYTGQEAFFIYEFTSPIGTNHLNVLQFDRAYNIQLTAANARKASLGQPSDEGTGLMGFSLRDADARYIDTINYLNGYRSGTGEALTGTALEGANMYSVPFAMEVLVGNPDLSNLSPNVVKVTAIKNVSNTNAPASYNFNSEANIENKSDELVNKLVTVNGKLYKREILIFKKLPFEGTQKITLDVGGSAKDVKFTMLFGPYVGYTSIFDNMTVYDDTNKLKSDRIADVITTALSNFKGTVNNINNTSEIRYDFDSNTKSAQTVFFYINNTPIKLQKQNTAAAGAVTDFMVLDTVAERTKAFDALFSGENEIKFVFQGSKNSYEKAVKLFLVPTNLPVIPVDGTTIYPYGSKYTEPLPNDPNFVNRGGIYTTNEANMNVFGTFDFIDFVAAGLTDADIVNNIQAKITQMGVPANNLTAPNKYILKIESSMLANPIVWDLTKQLIIMRGPAVLGTVNNTANNNVANLAVRYDIVTKTFSFILGAQSLNPDGSSSVYSFTVFNNGENGPKGSYRLEVDPTSLPYTLLRPILPNKSIVNQNFIEVIIDAPGANAITINDQVAEKIDYDSDNNPATIEQLYKNTYRVFVDKLKVGRNEIEFVISSANDKVESSFEITYAPTNIPGAQYLEPMASNHKVFENALNLKFEKGTTLIRTDFNVPANLKNQVFSGHNVLFSIANPEDGVVDRRELEAWPPNFNIVMESFGTRFRLSYPTRFTKASPVYWIDAGMADDPGTTAYDPLTRGVDPYQFPNATGTGGTKIPTYDERPDNRELITSKTGELTLSFDPNMRDSVGTVITVYRYDVKAKYWENLGGEVDVKKNTITVPFNKFGYYVVGKMVYSFTDMTTHPYARNFLEAIYAKGIMNAAGFDDFGSNMFVSRGEFAKMMVKALDIPLNYELSKPHFDDVPAIINPDALWDYRYVETAAREGIIRGTGPRTFQPSSNLTREEASVIISRALDLKLATDADKINKDLEKTFKDAGSVHFYAKSSVLAIAKKKYILGSFVDPSNPKAGSVFEPRSNLLRSDAAIIVARILADLKKLPDIG
ncbi:S-layer homology domain-containing protein [Paenibacillus alkaliterrae]|uniref:S-layer homology domain-containing protein n=1 Tax=Paenibacillus alkaliterrae TaxID=320909 RepID=UPI001F3EC413|nr:S-layer homology domain-containing protein [Paenibacillus alkaliterrae]MCF2938358.1 S-layer homology domain-containing protein [Paenibacillus alkaliterrae]